MRVQGPLQAPLPPPRRRKEATDKTPLPAQTQPEVIRLAPEMDYISGEETPAWDDRELSHSARRALQGYWSVAHQGHLWAEWRRIDLYV
ncbi:hypothetical protein SAMN05660443_1677 [Marinospirillum celere]|uniref:Uncharacterized protein n=1 Tax=Marinospirillum celere TaxID=1122252 RepID=A0A1I1GWS5_9GAMM|nr:hypothetical protein [Marinospirillum celere]SFC16124.1 hypothetical protein SAMN05660443_1677 [Marinospirillum celere]